MTRLQFTDGVRIDTSGPYRVIHKRDGWYVVGRGMCLPVDDEQEGREFIADLRDLEARDD
jgi:hypothetical protein